MLLTSHETSALKDLAEATSPAFIRKVRAALRASETDRELAGRLGLLVDDSAADARLTLESLPQNLRAGNVLFFPGEHRGTWAWIAFAWLRFHGEAYAMKTLRVSAGQMVGWENVEWDDPTDLKAPQP